MSLIDLDPFGKNPAQLATANLDVVGPSNPDPLRGQPQRPDGLDHGNRRHEGQPRLLVHEQAVVLGARAMVNVSDPSSDHHWFSPRPRPDVCRWAQTASGKLMCPSRRISRAMSLVDATSSKTSSSRTNGQVPISRRSPGMASLGALGRPSHPFGPVLPGHGRLDHGFSPSADHQSPSFALGSVQVGTGSAASTTPVTCLIVDYVQLRSHSSASSPNRAAKDSMIVFRSPSGCFLGPLGLELLEHG